MSIRVQNLVLIQPRTSVGKSDVVSILRASLLEPRESDDRNRMMRKKSRPECRSLSEECAGGSPASNRPFFSFKKPPKNHLQNEPERVKNRCQKQRFFSTSIYLVFGFDLGASWASSGPQSWASWYPFGGRRPTYRRPKADFSEAEGRLIGGRRPT